MNKNYAVFPCRNINITQNYNGQDQFGGTNGSHTTQSSSTNGIKSYPIDICYGDTYFMAPCRMKAVNMTYFNDDATTNIVNQVWFQSTEKVHLVNGEYEYITMLVTHPDDWDYDWSKVGPSYERGVDAVNQGTDGGVAAHLDIVVGVGLHSADWVKNSFNEGVLPNSRKPEEVFYIDSNYNNIINTCGINFQTIPSDAYTTLPIPVTRDTTKEQVQVICEENTLYVRTGAGTSNSSIGFAIPGIYNIISTTENNGYKWYQVEESKWMANVSGCTQELHIVAEEPEPVPEPVRPTIGEIDSYDTIPVGSQIIFSGLIVPKNYLICDGSTVSREDYSALFAIIGTSYGAGDGSTTFTLPNKKGRLSIGFDSEQEFNIIGKKSGEKEHLLVVNEMPTHTHVQNPHNHNIKFDQIWSWGGLTSLATTSGGPYGGSGYINDVTATNQNTGGSVAHNNMQPYEVDVFIIKAYDVISPQIKQMQEEIETLNNKVNDLISSASV